MKTVNSSAFIVLCILNSSAALASFFEDEKTSIMKCGRAAFYLDDTYMDAATRYYMKSEMKDVNGTAKEAMDIGQELRDEAEPDGRQTRHTLDVAAEWRDSDFCQNVLEVYAKKINEAAEVVSKKNIGDPSSVESCRVFVLKNETQSTPGVNEQIKKALQDSMHLAVDSVLAKFSAHKQEAMNKHVAENGYRDISEICRAGEVSLEKSIMETDAFNAAKSPVTKELQAYHDSYYGGSDCGKFSSYFCEGELRAKAIAEGLAASLECDKTGMVCTQTKDDFINPVFKEKKMAALSDAKKLILANGVTYDPVINDMNLELISMSKDKRVSDRSLAFQSAMNAAAGNRECGDFPRIFCESDLYKREAAIAYGQSIECDLAYPSSEGCYLDSQPITPDAYLAKKVGKIKVAKLSAAREELEEAIKNREVNAFYRNKVIDADLYRKVLDECRDGVYASNIPAGDELSKHLEDCLPRAEDAALKNSKDYLENITKKIAEIQPLVGE